MIRLLVLGLFFVTSSHSEPRIRFTYDEKPKLAWSDFKGIPISNVPYHASVNCGMGYTFKSQTANGKIRVLTEAHSYFYPEFSWKRNVDESNPLLLAHEQLHWDITELHTRILSKEFASYKPSSNPKADIKAIFEKIELQRKTMQLQYDRETVHGRNKEVQANWQIRVTELFFRL